MLTALILYSQSNCSSDRFVLSYDYKSINILEEHRNGYDTVSVLSKNSSL